MRVSMDSPMPGRSISCRCRLALMFAIFNSVLLVLNSFVGSLAGAHLHRRQPAFLAVQHMRLAQPARLVGVSFADGVDDRARSEEHTSELQSLMRIPYAV